MPPTLDPPPVVIYAAAGDADKAIPIIASLLLREPSDAFRALTTALLRLDPVREKVRSDSRFQAVLPVPLATGN